jgi:hypothetical protein
MRDRKRKVHGITHAQTGGNRRTLRSKRETDGRLGLVRPEDGKGHGLFGPAVPQFLEKNVTSSKGAMVDVDHRIADVEAGCLCLGHGERDRDCGIAGPTTCLDSLRRGEANRMAEAPLIEGEAGAVVSVGKIVKAVRCTQVEVSEREEGNERKERVLEAGGSLQHKKDWLQSSSQS